MTPNPSSPIPAPRAFLSHATPDKPFVDVVAKRLGRQRVKYDQWAFEVGTEFMKSIRASMAATDCFVLFASQVALQSLWVRFEIAEAEELMRGEVIKSALVVIVDRQVRHSDLPKWMQRALVDTAYTPNAVARLVEHQLNKLRGIEPNPLFIGRDALLAEFSEKLIPAPEEMPPHILIMSGLSGIGRKTFLRRALVDFLSVRLGAAFSLKLTDGIDALHLALLDELGGLDTKEQMALAIDQFQKATSVERAKTLAQLLASCCAGNSAPLIVDDGALIDSGGQYTDDAIAIFRALRDYPESVVGLVHTKRPVMSDTLLASIGAVFQRVPPLDLASTKLLLTQLLRRSGVVATSDQISEMAPYLDGYPPAVSLAASQARDYGMAVAVGDKSGLVDFQIRTFAGTLERLSLTNQQWSILKILASETALTLPGLVAVSGGIDEIVAQDLRRLLDLNLVLVSGTVFVIAAPIRMAVQSLKGLLTETDFATMAKALKTKYWDGVQSLPPLEIVQATIHAVMRSQAADLSDFRGFVLPSMLYRLAKEYYDRGGQDAWERALEFIDQLIKLDPQHRHGWLLHAKTHIRLQHWSQATSTIEHIQSMGLAEHHSLRGFMYWKRRNYAQAVLEYRSALAVGQNSVEAVHGLASCLLRLNEYSEADKVIQRGLHGRRQNSLLLDLAAQIAIIRGNYDDAEIYIDKLRRVRADADYHHRMATLLNARKQYQQALPHAEQAMNSTRRRFEMDATYVDTLIELRRFSRATELLDHLDGRKRFGRDKESVRLGLRCKLFLRQKRWRDAETMWASISDGDKDAPVHVALRMEILEQKIADLTTSPGVRAVATAELGTIQGKAKSPNIGLFAEVDEEPELADVESEAEHG
jgi:tetratricopeptide (TPR) repeat protein